MRIISTIIIALCAVGCAHPHRAGTSRHEIRTYAGRPDGLIRLETFEDTEKGGGTFFFTDAQTQALSVSHENQIGLGGHSVITTGPLSVTVDPQTGNIIGTAIGTAAATTLKALAK